MRVPAMARRNRLARLALVTSMVTLGSVQVSTGTPSQEPTGRFLAADFSISPPVAGTRRHPQGVSVEVNDLAGNDVTGQHATGNAQTQYEDFRLARGMTVNHRDFPMCMYRSLVRLGPPACPHHSEIGTGLIITDFRPVVSTFFPVLCTAFNGRGPHGEPAMLVWCKSSFGASGTMWFDILPPVEGSGPRFRDDAGPTPFQGIAEGNTGVHITFPDSVVVVHGRRVHYFEAPTSCHGSWLFEQVNTRYNGTRQVASSRQPCVG